MRTDREWQTVTIYNRHDFQGESLAFGLVKMDPPEMAASLLVKCNDRDVQWLIPEKETVGITRNARCYRV
jgi:hypothetical protein